MLKRIGDFKLGRFDYLYMFVLIIYMGQATPETSRMVGDLSGNPIPLLIPIIMTFILWTKHPVPMGNKKLILVLAIYCIWAILSLIKYGVYTTGELSYHFFMVYAIIVAYIMDAIYGYKLLPLYEKVMVWFCKIAVVLWLISLIPGSSVIFSMFPKTYIGTNVLYIYEWNDHNFRNSGVAWEPGRFAIMIILAIYCNLCQHGIKFRNNKNIWWLLIAMATTMSTTGFVTTIVLYGLYMLKKINVKTILTFIVIMVPIIISISQLDFMQDKISSKIEDAQNIDRLNDVFEWHNENDAKDKYLGSIDRFEAMVFEWINLENDPLLGYSRNTMHSYFYRNISTNYALANGSVKLFGMYGLILGSLLYIILWKSSKKLSIDSDSKCPMGLFLIIILISTSYPIFSVPIFTAFWFYGIFVK